jgi:predicted nucleotidyltransferase
MDKRINKIIERYILYLKKKDINFEKVYLFGSYAKSKQTEYSDIDLALIYQDSKIDNFDLQVKLLSLASDIDTRIEPHPINFEDFTMENPLAFEIIKTGQEVKIS